MSENIPEQLESRIDSFFSSIESANEFVLEQSPLVVQEYISWFFWGAVFRLGLAFFSVVMTLTAMRAIFKITEIDPEVWSDDDDKKMVRVLSVFVGCILLLIAFLAAIDSTQTILKVYISPRVVLLEKIAELMR